MPQRRGGVQAVLMNLKQQSAKALASLQQEITTRERELDVLKEAEARWQAIVGGQTTATGSASIAMRGRAARRKRLNWDAVLAGLPVTFKSKEVQQRTGKPAAQVYAGLARWVKDKKVKRNPDGIYQKLSSSAAQKKTGA